MTGADRIHIRVYAWKEKFPSLFVGKNAILQLRRCKVVVELYLRRSHLTIALTRCQYRPGRAFVEIQHHHDVHAMSAGRDAAMQHKRRCRRSGALWIGWSNGALRCNIPCIPKIYLSRPRRLMSCIPHFCRCYATKSRPARLPILPPRVSRYAIVTPFTGPSWRPLRKIYARFCCAPTVADAAHDGRGDPAGVCPV